MGILYPGLKAEMARRGETQQDLAKLLSLGTATICRKMRRGSEWSQSEIEKICGHYGKNYEDLFINREA